MDVSRRNFLKGAAAGTAGAALAGGVLIGGARADAAASDGDGDHGVLSVPRRSIRRGC